MRWRFAWLVAGVVLTATACGYSDPYASTSPIANESPGRATPSPGFDDFHAGDGLTPIVFPDGLKSIDLKVGTGAVARSGDDATVHYTGWLADGTMFDSSRVRNQAFDFTIGQGQVIPGWDEGVPGRRRPAQAHHPGRSCVRCPGSDGPEHRRDGHPAQRDACIRDRAGQRQAGREPVTYTQIDVDTARPRRAM